METNNKRNKGSGQRRKKFDFDQRQIGAAPEEKLLGAHEQLLINENNYTPMPKAKSAAKAAAIGMAGTTAAASATSKPRMQKATSEPAPEPLIDEQTEDAVPRRTGWSTTILAILAVMGVFAFASLIYTTYFNKKAEKDIEYAQMQNERYNSGAQISDMQSSGIDYSRMYQPQTSQEIGNFTKVVAIPVAAPSPAELTQGRPYPVLVYFYPVDYSSVKENAALNDMAQKAIESDRVIVIDSYTDETGSDAYNKQLSERRAKEMAQYMQRHGVPVQHLISHGNGPSEKYPTYDRNRRTELTLK